MLLASNLEISLLISRSTRSKLEHHICIFIQFTQSKDTFELGTQDALPINVLPSSKDDDTITMLHVI